MASRPCVRGQYEQDQGCGSGQSGCCVCPSVHTSPYELPYVFLKDKQELDLWFRMRSSPTSRAVSQEVRERKNWRTHPKQTGSWSCSLGGVLILSGKLTWGKIITQDHKGETKKILSTICKESTQWFFKSPWGEKAWEELGGGVRGHLRAPQKMSIFLPKII